MDSALRASTSRWTTANRWIGVSSTVVDFQRLIMATKTVPTRWQTFQRVRANAAGVAQFVYPNARPMRYRMVTEETTQAFGATSAVGVI